MRGQIKNENISSTILLVTRGMKNTDFNLFVAKSTPDSFQPTQ